jgi:hypothetical protein
LHAIQSGETCDKSSSIERFELMEHTSINNSSDDLMGVSRLRRTLEPNLSDIERFLAISGDYSTHLIRREERLRIISRKFHLTNIT